MVLEHIQLMIVLFAADHAGCLNFETKGEIFRKGFDLYSQFPGRCNDQSPGLPFQGSELIQYRQEECGSLAGASPRLYIKIMSLHEQRDRCFLDRGQAFVAKIV